MTYWHYMVVLALALTIFIFLSEWKRKNSSRLGFRLLASILALAALVGLASPHWTSGKKNGNTLTVILTAGFSGDSIRKFAAQCRYPLALFTLSKELADSATRTPVKWISDTADFAHNHTGDTVQVFGDGFSKPELAYMRNIPFVFHPGAQIPSIIEASWNQQLHKGESLILQGRIENPGEQTVIILLKAFGQTLDSVTIRKKGLSDFILQTIPKNKGRSLYSLLAFSGRDTLQMEPLAFEVKSVDAPAILFMSSAPNFENTFLRNSLAQEGSKINSLTRISKKRSDIQFLNMAESNNHVLTSGFLDQFDVLITDGDALNELSAAEADALQSSISQQGLGLILTIDSASPKASKYYNQFPLANQKPRLPNQFHIHSNIGQIEPFRIKTAAAFIRQMPGAQALLEDSLSHILAAATQYGNGKIIATALNNTFTLALEGNKKMYRDLWAFLIGKAAKKMTNGPAIIFNPAIPYLNEPVNFQIEQFSSAAPGGSIAGAGIYFLQQPFLSWIWTGNYWPVTEGWQSFQDARASDYAYYVYNPRDWKTINNYRKRWQTINYSSVNNPFGKLPVVQTNTGYSAVWQIILSIVLLASLTFLWVEQKLI